MKNHKLSLSLLFSIMLMSVAAQTQLTNLPTVYVTTEANQPVLDKTTWIPANIIVRSSESTEMLDMATEIRGRGNSTWGMSKKPYRIKLDQKKNFLNLPAKEKNWVFLANYADKTLIRNALAFEISRIIGMEFSPSAKFVDFYLNNSYLGNYMVSDQIEVNPFRVPVQKQDSLNTQEPEITGGYLLEIDGFASTEPLWFTTAKGLKVTVKYPDDEDINAQQLNYIRNYIADFESRLFAANFKDELAGYRAKVDTTSLINWYIACELTGNSDAFWSTYIYKKNSDDKLYFGPLWDFDIAFNNDNRLGDATQKLMRESAHNPRTWIEQLCRDEWFQLAVSRRWQQLVQSNLQGKLTTFITQTAELIETSQQLNFQRWNNLNTRVYRETYLFDTYAKGVDYLKTYVGNRIAYLNDKLFVAEPEKPSEPFVAENMYYMVMNKRTNNVIDVSNGSVAENAMLVLWEPRLDDEGQLWEIHSLGTDLYRFVNKRSRLAMAGNGRGNNLKQVVVNDADDSQKWKIVPVKTGNIYGIVNAKTNYSINNSGGSFANGTNAIEWDNNIENSENQQWYLQKIEMIGTSVKTLYADLQGVEVYPNPARDVAILQFALHKPTVVSVTISGIDGKRVWAHNENFPHVGSNRIDLPVSSMNSGIYLVTLTTSEGETAVTKLIVGR